MRIFFIRHGESQANICHEISNRGLRYGLTMQGREQSLDLALLLESKGISRIYSSPVLRAIETSILLASRLGVEYEICEALREYDCGILEGRSDEEAHKGWKDLFDAWVLRQEWERRIEGGESFYDIRARFVPFIEGLVQDYGNNEANIACVSHGGLYWMMLPVVLRNVDAALIERFGLGYTACIEAELRGEELFCLAWNFQAQKQGKEPVGRILEQPYNPYQE
jgi:broad specificity phosphatase PhoE